MRLVIGNKLRGRVRVVDGSGALGLKLPVPVAFDLMANREMKE